MTIGLLDTVVRRVSEWLMCCSFDYRYDESAAMFAQTQNSFEEVALKFIKLPNKEPLQTFIIEKLNLLRPQVRTEIISIVLTHSAFCSIKHLSIIFINHF